MQQKPILNLPDQKINIIVYIILGLTPLVGMGIDLITPSLPAISQNLGISHVIAKDLITVYLLGYALGCFLIGFLSDALGRRKLIISGFLMFVIVSLLPTFFPNASMLLVARLLQGFSIAAFAVIGRALLSDVLPPEKLIRVAIMLATMWGIGPVIGPVIGGYLQYYFNWQACFYFFALFGFVGLTMMILFIPETHFNRQPLNFKQISNNFFTIVQHRLFIGLVTLMGTTYSLLIVFNTLGPFLIQTEFGRSPVYFGHMALCMGLAFLLGTITCRRIVKYYVPEKILLFAIPTFLLIAVIGVMLTFIDNQNIWIIAVLSLFMFFCCGIIFPASMGKGLALFRHLAGSGSAVMNLINILITSIMAFLLSFINATNTTPLALIYLMLMVLCSLDYWLLVHQRSKTT